MKGIRITVCTVALVVSCLVVASVTAAAHENTSGSPQIVTYAGGTLTIDSEPFFPVMGLVSRCPTADVVGQMVGIGINTLSGYALSCISSRNGGVEEEVQNLHAALQGRVNWMEQDPSVGYWPQGLPELTKWQTHVQWDNHDGQQLKSCDTHSALAAYNGVSKLSKKGPVILRIPVTANGGLDQQDGSCLTGSRVSVLFWIGVLEGNGVQYLTQDIGQDAPLFDVSTSVQSQAAKDSDQLRHFLIQAVLNGTPVTSSMEATGSSVKFGAWKYNGATYVLAVNLQEESTTTTFSMSKVLKNVRSPSETRQLKINGKKFTDRFTKFGKHIYVIH